MNSGIPPAWLIGVLSLMAVGGGLVAWKVGGSHASRLESKSAATAAKKSRSGRANPLSSRDRELADLPYSYDSIRMAAVPGEVNDKLIHACHTVLMDTDDDRRARNYGLLLQLMRPVDGPALHEQFLELQLDGMTFEESKAMALRWGEVDAAGAINYLTAQDSLELPGGDFRPIARGWAHVDPQGALAWIEENPDAAEKVDAKAALIEGWMLEDEQAALTWIGQNITSMQPRDYVDAVRIAFEVQVNGATSAEAATDWLTSLPDTAYSEQASISAWESIEWNLGGMPCEKAAAVWAKVGDREWMRFDQFQGFSGAICRNRATDQGMQEFLIALEKTWPADRITSQFSRWTTENPEQTLEWLAVAPSSSVTQAAIRGAVEALEKINPAAASNWAAKLN